MAWPTDDISTTNLDSDNDLVPRPMILRIAQRLKSVLGARGTADGVASLDGNSRVPDAQLGRNLANGVAGLNGNGQVPAARIAGAREEIYTSQGGRHITADIAAGTEIVLPRALSDYQYLEITLLAFNGTPTKFVSTALIPTYQISLPARRGIALSAGYVEIWPDPAEAASIRLRAYGEGSFTSSGGTTTREEFRLLAIFGII